MRTQVILTVSTGDIALTTREFSRAVMKNTVMQIILLDGRYLKRIQQSPVELVEILNEQAQQALEIKKSQRDSR